MGKRLLQQKDAIINFLPREVLETILLRLPLAAVIQAKQVCKKWKRAVNSRSFTNSYSSTAKVTEVIMMDKDDSSHFKESIELRDSEDNVLDFGRLDFVGELSCPKTGLMIAHDCKNKSVCVGNIFSNKWEKLPMCKRYTDTIAPFGFGDGLYKLVHWDYQGEIYTLETGQQEWTRRWAPNTSTHWSCWSSIALMGNSVFRVFSESDKARLMEYNILGEGKLSSMDITSEEDLDLAGIDTRNNLMSWEGRLYVLPMPDETFCKLELWEISNTNGNVHATRVMKREFEEGLHHYHRPVIEDGKLVVQCARPEDDFLRAIIFDMKTETGEFLCADSLCHTRTLPVTL